MCASSCASNASTWSRGNCVSNDSGSQTSGRNTWAVNGDATCAAIRALTDRETPIACLSTSKRCSHSTGNGTDGACSMRRNARQPPNWRITISATPNSHACAMQTSSQLPKALATGLSDAAPTSSACAAAANHAAVDDAAGAMACQYQAKVIAGAAAMASSQPMPTA